MKQSRTRIFKVSPTKMVHCCVYTLIFIITSFCEISGAPCGEACCCCLDTNAGSIDAAGPTIEQQDTRTFGFITKIVSSIGQSVSDWVAGMIAPYLEPLNDWSQQWLGNSSDKFEYYFSVEGGVSWGDPIDY